MQRRDVKHIFSVAIAKLWVSRGRHDAKERQEEHVGAHERVQDKLLHVVLQLLAALVDKLAFKRSEEVLGRQLRQRYWCVLFPQVVLQLVELLVAPRDLPLHGIERHVDLVRRVRLLGQIAHSVLRGGDPDIDHRMRHRVDWLQRQEERALRACCCRRCRRSSRRVRTANVERDRLVFVLEPLVAILVAEHEEVCFTAHQVAEES